MKTNLQLLILLVALTFGFTTINAQIVTIPDANFKAYLVANTTINTNNDTEIQVVEANAFTGTIDCNGLSISDLTGIEEFTALKRLYCQSNLLTSLNVSANTSLTYLYCQNNSLTSLNVTTNTALTRLYCQNNQLISLDVSANTVLTTLYCQDNSLTSLDVTTNTALKYLYCQNNSLTNLNVTTNTALTRLYCQNNSLPSLDVTTNILLKRLYCYNNLLPNLDVSANTTLEYLYCYSNTLSSLTVTANTALIQLFCQNNSLPNLDVSANTALTYLKCNNNSLTNLTVTTNIALQFLYCQNNSLTNLDVSTNTLLKRLYCYSNSLATLDVSTNTALEHLRCQSNQLTELNVASGNNANIIGFNAKINPNLTCIEVDDVAYSTTNWLNIDSWASFSTNCYYNQTYVPDNNFENYLETHNASGAVVALGSATSMGNGIANDDYVTTANINTVTNLSIPNLSISDLTGIEDFTALNNLLCWNNNLTSLDVSQNTNLAGLKCNGNMLTNLNLNNNIALTSLKCYFNNLTSLYLSNNVNLVFLRCEDNQLTNLNVANGNNTNIPTASFNATNNPNLTCIEVDVVAYSNTNWTNKDSWASFNTNCNPNATYVPDLNFENYLETHNASGIVVALGSATSMGNGIANDNYVTTANINTVTNLDVNTLNITDLTGIEDFIALKYLYCQSNLLTSLDVTANTALIRLFCQNNSLPSLDVSANTALTYLKCNNNLLPSLDVATNTALQFLYCNDNLLSSLDVSTNVLLERLYCYNNSLTNLTVTTNTALQFLYCQNNSLPSLDVSTNTLLKRLYCHNNSLTSLDVSTNTLLKRLYCYSNSLATLDVSANTALEYLRCQSNQLTELNVASGNNANIIGFNAKINPNLTCIEVDDVAYSTTNWLNIDSWASFSTNCYYNQTYVPDNNFENYLETHNASGAVVALGSATSMGNGIANDDYVFTASINTVTNLDVSSQSIADLTGIEDFIALQGLNCYANQLTSLDFTNNTALKYLTCFDNLLTSLNVTSNNALLVLWCSKNQLTSVDVTSNPVLYALHCGDNQLTSLDVNSNPLLDDLRCQSNQIVSLTTSSNPLLASLICNSNLLNSLDLTTNTALTYLDCHDNLLTDLNAANGTNTIITNFNATSNPNLTCIQVDSPSYSTTNWLNIDPASAFSNNCPNICSYPTNLSFSTQTATGATLSWLENGTATLWDIEIGAQGFSPTGTPTDNNVSNPFIWSNGMVNTSYDYYVRADCTGINTVTSAWTGPFTFSTITACAGGNFVLDTTTAFNGVINSGIAFADIDSDGDQDVLITGKSASGVIAELYTNNAGVFTLVAGTPFAGVKESDVAFSDIDNDGDLDVVISGQNASGVFVLSAYLNNGSGVFSFAGSAPTTYSFASIAFADVDNNGYKDLMVVGYGASDLYMNGLILSTTTNFTALGKSSVDFADVDGDGDQDVVISGIDPGGLYKTELYLNDGLGNFTLNAQSFQGVFRGDNEFSDIDNDGDQDLLVTGYNAGTYYSNLYKNNGSGVFTLVSTPFLDVFASSVAFSDVDGDGDNDVLITGASSTSGRVSKLYTNDGTGIFTVVAGTPFDGIDSGSVAFADVDGDGDNDVLITGQNVGSTKIAKLYLNDSFFETTYNASGWTNGLPSLTKCAVIDKDYTTASFSSYKTTVNASKTLTIAANTFMEVQKNIENNGIITIEPTGSIVQIEDTATVTGTGVYNTKIETTPLQDNTRYTYFSSPSATETLNVFAPWADMSYLWEFNETIQNWDYITNTATAMQAGNGYIVRGNLSNTYPGFTGLTNFQNAYNNGVITQPLIFKGDGSPTANLDNDSNLVGNPYPSAINATKLLNSTLNPTAGTLYFWTHNTAMVGGQFTTDDYAMWNLSGGTAAAISGGTAPTGYIASGQGFFMDAEGNENSTLGAIVTSTLTFNNEMRETSNNTDFYRPASPINDKIWLNISNSQGVFNQMLLAFLPNATTQFDIAYDGRKSANGVAILYSVGLENQHYGIQALPLLQDETIVPLGYQIENENITNLTVSIDHIENMQDVTVYLKDNLLNVIHDLSQDDYNFAINDLGIFDTRFEIVFRNSALSTDDLVLQESLIVANNDHAVLVKTTNGTIIKAVEIYDVLGKLLIKTSVNKSKINIPTNINEGTVLFIKAHLENGSILTKKMIKL